MDAPHPLDHGLIYFLTTLAVSSIARAPKPHEFPRLEGGMTLHAPPGRASRVGGAWGACVPGPGARFLRSSSFPSSGVFQ